MIRDISLQEKFPDIKKLPESEELVNNGISSLVESIKGQSRFKPELGPEIVFSSELDKNKIDRLTKDFEDLLELISNLTIENINFLTSGNSQNDPSAIKPVAKFDPLGTLDRSNVSAESISKYKTISLLIEIIESYVFNITPESEIPNLQYPTKKSLAIWTGRKAAEFALKNSDVVSILDVPIFQLLYTLWARIFFCSEIPDDKDFRELLKNLKIKEPKDIAKDSKVKELKERILIRSITLKEDGHSNNNIAKEISREFFGSRLSNENLDLSGKMAAILSIIFIEEIKSNSNNVHFYFSHDQSQNNIGKDLIPLHIGTLAWNIELPTLRALMRNIKFYEVDSKGQPREVELGDIKLLQTSGIYPIKILDNRAAYPLESNSLSILMRYAQPPRTYVSVATTQLFFQKCRERIVAKSLCNDADGAIEDIKEEEESANKGRAI